MPRLLSLRGPVALGLLFFSVAATAQVGSGAVSYTASGASQNFDTLANSGTSSTLPTGWYFHESNNDTSYTANDGSSNSGTTYSYGTGTATDRALGGIRSGSNVPTFGARLSNATGAALTQLAIQYTGEQWRTGARSEVDRLDFQYSTNATSIIDAAATWVNEDSLDFVAPVASGAVDSARNGNDAANRTAKSATITGLNVANGANIHVRWLDLSVASNDDGLAIDDVVFGVPVDNPPTVASSVPAHNDIDVAVDSSISVTFSEPVAVSGDWFALNSCGGVTLTASSSPATTYTFTRSGPLPYGGLCSLVIDGSLVTDLDGTPDALGGVVTIQFETVADNLPEVIATTPADLATDVSRSANLSVTFNEPVTAPASAFGIFCPDSAMASLAFALSSDDDTLFVLDPASDLPASTSCKLTVDNLQVFDQDGNADNPDRDTLVLFTTAALAPPAVVSTVPEKNSTTFPSAGDLQVVFDSSVTLGAGAFTLACTQSTGISLSHAASGTSFVIGTGTALIAGDTCTFTIEADAVTSGDGLHPLADEVVNFAVASSGPGGYYAQVNTSSAEQLRCSLHEIIDGHTAYPYTAASTDTWDILNLADEDPVDSTMILDVYKNARYTKITGGTGIYNREHTWPNTYGFSSGSPGAYTDAHMLHLTNTQYNSDRGSKPFADVPTCGTGCLTLATDANYGVGGGGGGDSNYALSAGSENLGSFEVWDHLKGNMARAMMYMVIRYEGGDGEPDLELTDNRSLITSGGSGGKHYMGLLTTLLAWHQADPVDARELERNEVVFGFQNNRNPFVDHPEWGTLALMTSNQPATCTLAGGGNAAPVAVDDVYQAIEDSLLTVSALDGVLDNDTDADNDTLTAALIAQAINGTVTLNANGSFTYAPNANSCGSDQFTYQASDGQAQSAAAIATINVACVNDAPVANDATFNLPENSAAATPVGTVVATDPDAGTTLSYSITAGNGSGAFAISSSGQVTVANSTPLDFELTPQFVLTVTVSDGPLSDTAQITINLSNVNEAPAANDATFMLPENSPAETVVGQVVASDVDSDTTLLYSITAGNGSGAFAISAAGQITVVNSAPLDYETTPQFVLTVAVSDGTLSDTATVTVNLSGVLETVANDDHFTHVVEDSGPVFLDVFANDVPDGMIPFVISSAGPAQHGTVTFNHSFVQYAPDADYCGPDSFSYTNGNDSANVTLEVQCVNDAPVALGPLADQSGSEGLAIAPFSIAGEFADVDAGDDLDYSQTGLPAGLTLDPENGMISGTPAAGSAGASPYAVTITASDGTAQAQLSFSFSIGVRADTVFRHGFEGN